MFKEGRRYVRSTKNFSRWPDLQFLNFEIREKNMNKLKKHRRRRRREVGGMRGAPKIRRHPAEDGQACEAMGV